MPIRPSGKQAKNLPSPSQPQRGRPPAPARALPPRQPVRPMRQPRRLPRSK
ncbi:hypothetical protein GCM10023194_10500 [Planotetraspora phitsanulokensis]|uniref:Uncharacterized protein n=1 Tax=Planotetraspora phitsanulokensis TaxID=575192 RepID=A0A8J3XGZ4_9ACTN|nr:hypothetical protein [Planotetraspora phitsanulokensis]GII40625.1 hypothetical protein Pph01_56280 [Planotetraspora phitsanulokensis]